MSFKEKSIRIVDFFENTPLTISSWAVSFLVIMVTRVFVEQLIFGYRDKNMADFVGFFIHGTVLFFLLSYLIFLFFLKIITKEKTKKIATILLWGWWLIVLPPIINKVIFGDSFYKSFYLFGSVREIFYNFFVFFGDKPNFGITYGIRVLILLMIFFVGFYVYIKTEKKLLVFLGMLGSYVILYFLGVFPSLVVFLVDFLRGENIGEIQDYNIATIFFTQLTYWGCELGSLKYVIHYKLAFYYNILLVLLLLLFQYYQNRKKFLSLIRNIRLPQVIYHEGLLLVGFGLAIIFSEKTLIFNEFGFLAVINASLAVVFAWFSSVVFNDLADIKIDEKSNKSRPLVRRVFSKTEYRGYALIFSFLAMLSGLVVSSLFFFLIIFYLLITWVYSSYPFRLRRLVFVSSLVSAFASLLIFLAGFFLVTGPENHPFFPWRVIIFLLLAYSLVIPVKDLKDRRADKEEGVITLPVLVGEKNTKLILSIIVFSCYMASVWVVGEKDLFWPALVFGLMSYGVINNKKITHQNLLYFLLLGVMIYGVVLAWVAIW